MTSTTLASTFGRRLASFVLRGEFERRPLPVSDPDMIVWDEEAQSAAERGYSLGAIEFDQNLTPAPGLDVVVTDVQLPAISGQELLASLRANSGGMPVVMMSGRSVEISEIVSKVARRQTWSRASVTNAPEVPGSFISSTAQTMVESGFDFHAGLSMEVLQRQTTGFLPGRRMQSKTEINFARDILLGLDAIHPDAADWRSMTETVHMSSKRFNPYRCWQPDLTTRLAYRLSQVSDVERAPDSIMPSQEVIDAALRVVGYLSATTRLPQIEIDDSNGAISLVWRDANDQNTFALEIPNSRYVVGVGFGEDFSRFKPWRYLISDERKIVGAIEASESAKKLLSDA